MKFIVISLQYIFYSAFFHFLFQDIINGLPLRSYFALTLSPLQFEQHVSVDVGGETLTPTDTKYRYCMRCKYTEGLQTITLKQILTRAGVDWSIKIQTLPTSHAGAETLIWKYLSVINNWWYLQVELVVIALNLHNITPVRQLGVSFLCSINLIIAQSKWKCIQFRTQHGDRFHLAKCDRANRRGMKINLNLHWICWNTVLS